jgi:S-adenosylmethionine-diacylglycerol 3-amino-3-carboxypropyl transferase
VRERLGEPARYFWDRHPATLRAGILGTGRFEKYLAMFRERVLPLVHRRRTVERWFELPDLDARRRYYDEVWNNLRWRWLFRLFFSRRVMAARGRSPEQFAHVEGPIGDVLLERARKMLVDLPLDDNGYAQWILLGRYLRDEALPEWLTPAGHRRLSEVAPRIRLVHGTVQQVMAEAGRGAFSAFNLSDVPEYLSAAQTEDLYDALLLSARPRARIAYWNLFVPRRRPEVHARRVVERSADAIALHARDRAPLYGAFRLEEVR